MNPTTKNSAGFPMPDRKGRDYKVHIISGTHWDREWRFTAEQSKFRLAELVDSVIDIMEKDPDYRHFVLDGGSIVLEDYLDVRPEKRPQLQALIKAGRISVVNWYTLPDNNLVAPEALVRNLLVGRRIANQHGGAMKEGYTATSYGQPAQLPQIYQGFGIQTALFYRGTNKYVVPPVCRWQGRDGSKLLLIRCFDEWNRSNWAYYGYMPILFGKVDETIPLSIMPYHAKEGASVVHMADEQLCEMGFKALNEQAPLPDDDTMLVDRYQMFRDQAYKYAIGRHVVGLDMEDNASPKENQSELVRRLNAALTDTEVVHVSVDEYVQDVLQEIDGIDLYTATGEMRYTAVEFGMNGLYGLTMSSRVKMKLLNEHAETNLILLAEPLATVAAGLGQEYPRQHLDNAWLALLKNHAHDSICGASNDDVHEDMIYRFRQVQSAAEEVSKRALEHIWDQIGQQDVQAQDQSLTVFNTLLSSRQGVYKFVLDLPCEDFDTPGYHRHLKSSTDRYLFDILDEKGAKVPYTITDVQDIKIHCESIIESSGASLQVKRHRIVMPVDLPAMGYSSFKIRKRKPDYVPLPPVGPERGHIAQPGGVLQNEHLHVQINPNGTFNLTDKAGGRTYDNLHYFQDQVSTGHSHIDSVVMQSDCVTTLGSHPRISVAESNPQRGCYRLDYIMQVPKEATGDWYRSHDLIDMPITVWLTLAQGSRRLEIRTKLDNTARDHRLQAVFPTGVATDQIAVEAPFAVETRDILPKQTGDNVEPYYFSQPMQNFVDMTDEKGGLAVLTKGIREYMAWDDPQRTVSLTLFRSYRPYVNANTNMTPEEKQKYTGSHAMGELEFEYALCPHQGDWRQGGVLAEAYDFKTPVRAIQGPAQAGQLPARASFVEVDPADKVMLSALCQSEDGKGMILRLWNTTDETVNATVKTILPFKSVSKVNLGEDETLEPLSKKGDTVSVDLRGAEIATLKFQ